MKYYAEITGWGDEAKAFLKELNYIILFNDNAPSELAEISILHSIGEMKGDIEVGDTIIIAEKAFDPGILIVIPIFTIFAGIPFLLFFQNNPVRWLLAVRKLERGKIIFEEENHV